MLTFSFKSKVADSADVWPYICVGPDMFLQHARLFAANTAFLADVFPPSSTSHVDIIFIGLVPGRHVILWWARIDLYQSQHCSNTDIVVAWAQIYSCRADWPSLEDLDACRNCWVCGGFPLLPFLLWSFFSAADFLYLFPVGNVHLFGLWFPRQLNFDEQTFC